MAKLGKYLVHAPTSDHILIGRPTVIIPKPKSETLGRGWHNNWLSFSLLSFSPNSFAFLLLCSDQRKQLRRESRDKKDVGRGAPLRVEGRRRRFKDLPSAGWNHSQERLHRDQGQALQGIMFFCDFFPLFLIFLSVPNLIWLHILLKICWLIYYSMRRQSCWF